MSDGSSDLKQLQKRLGYSFTNIQLLQQAVTHRSWFQQNPKTHDWNVQQHNETLEFFVLQMMSS